MSQGRFSPPLAPEDDWFDEPEWFAEPDTPSSAGGEVPHEPRASHTDTVGSPKRPADKRLIAVAVLLVLALLVGGVLAARALTGPDSAGETTSTTTPTATTAPTATTPTTPEPAAPTTTTDTTSQPESASLRPGDEGERVRQLQEELVALGYSTGGVDGKFGPATEQAVRDFQTSSGLVVDGVAGVATLAALSSATTP